MNRDRRLILAGLITWMAGCRSERDPVATEVESLVRRSVPEGGRLTASVPPLREAHLTRASWVVVLPDTWTRESYGRWLAEQFPDYRPDPPEAGSATVIRKRLPGDSYTLHASVERAGGETRAELSFLATPS